MSLLLNPRVIGAVLVLVFLAGLYVFGYQHGKRVTAAGYERALVQAEKQAQERITAAYKRADLAQAQYQSERIDHAATARKARSLQASVTSGRECISGPGVGVLNDTIRGADAVPKDPGKPAEGSGAAATDTDVFTWAIEVIDKYASCRSQLSAIRQFQGTP